LTFLTPGGQMAILLKAYLKISVQIAQVTFENGQPYPEKMQEE
jgi:hypothetical protein